MLAYAASSPASARGKEKPANGIVQRGSDSTHWRSARLQSKLLNLVDCYLTNHVMWRVCLGLHLLRT